MGYRMIKGSEYLSLWRECTASRRKRDIIATLMAPESRRQSFLTDRSPTPHYVGTPSFYLAGKCDFPRFLTAGRAVRFL